MFFLVLINAPSTEDWPRNSMRSNCLLEVM